MKELCESTLAEALKGLKKKDFSSLELMKSCLERIKKYDGLVKAFITVTDDAALSQAKSSDELISKRGEDIFENFPLLGIPYACKDNFCTKGIKTTAASKILEDFIPPYESTVTSKLKNAGAVLIGKTNMDAFAHGSSTETSDFFTTRNPWNLQKVAGGSSGGSAAAVASHMCVFAIGSETAGSIRGPAAWCGVTGLKPTYGVVSRYGLIAMASSTDSPGPITKSASDAEILLGVLAGKDELDATSVSPDSAPQHKRKPRLGIPQSYFMKDLNYAVEKSVKSAIDKFKELGFEVISVDLLDPKYAIATYTIVQRSEVSSNLARFDGIRYGNGRESFGFEAKKRITLGAYALSVGYYDQYYAKAQKVRTLIIDNFDDVFSKVDLIVSPTMPTPALSIGESGRSSLFGELTDILTEPGAVAGLPALSIPCEPTGDGLPVGLQLIGNRFSEKVVLEAGKLFQNNTKYHSNFPDLRNYR